VEANKIWTALDIYMGYAAEAGGVSVDFAARRRYIL